MTILSELIVERLPSTAGAGNETNLENGVIYAFSPSTHCTNTFIQNMCWIAPATGQAVIEIWGASGSGGRMCCCGGGVPGNPGGYVKKTVNVQSGDFVTGVVGVSCQNEDLCWSGCSQSTCISVCYNGKSACVCLCAEGGYGGYAICAEGGNGMACCLINQFGLPSSEMSSGCGIVCNLPCRGRGYGGDVNKCGGQSCTRFWSCCSCCHCRNTQILAISPGVFGSETSWIAAPMENSGGYNDGQGAAAASWNASAALGALSKSGFMGWNGQWVSCWSGNRACTCYSSHSKGQHLLPYGVPGMSAFPCSSVRDSGWRGGMGNVRIKFIGS